MFARLLRNITKATKTDTPCDPFEKDIVAYLDAEIVLAISDYRPSINRSRSTVFNEGTVYSTKSRKGCKFIYSLLEQMIPSNQSDWILTRATGEYIP